MNTLSEKRGFAPYWRMLADNFKFTPAEIERIWNADRDDTERCLLFLHKWSQKEGSTATVSRLIQGVYSTGNTTMLEIAHSVLNH